MPAGNRDTSTYVHLTRRVRNDKLSPIPVVPVMIDWFVCVFFFFIHFFLSTSSLRQKCLCFLKDLAARLRIQFPSRFHYGANLSIPLRLLFLLPLLLLWRFLLLLQTLIIRIGERLPILSIRLDSVQQRHQFLIHRGESL